MESVHETQWKLVHGINFNVVMMDSMKISRLTQKNRLFHKYLLLFVDNRRFSTSNSTMKLWLLLFFLVFVWYVKVGRDFKAIRHIEHWLFVPDNRNWNRVNIRLLFFAQEATEMLLCKYKISIIPIDSLWLWYTKGVPGNSRDCLDAFYSLFRVYQIETRVAARFRIQYLFAGKNGVFGCLWKKNETFTDFKRNWSIHFCDFR